MITAIIIVLVVLAVVAFTAASASIRVLREYERGVVFRLGRLMDQRGPGLILLVPTIDRMVRDRLRGYVCAAPVHAVMVARHDAEMRAALARSTLTVPDGMPIVWAANLLGEQLPDAGKRTLQRIKGRQLAPDVNGNALNL